MIRSRSKLPKSRNYSGGNGLAKQLEREITCLQRQLERMQGLGSDEMIDDETRATYEEMIESRKEMLEKLHL